MKRAQSLRSCVFEIQGRKSAQTWISSSTFGQLHTASRNARTPVTFDDSSNGPPGLRPRPHALRCESPPPPLRWRHRPPLLDGTPLHARLRQPLHHRIIPRPPSILQIRHQSNPRNPLPLPFLHLPLALRLLLLEFNNQGFEILFGGGRRAVVHGRPGEGVGGERVGAVLEEHAERFEFASGGGVVEGGVAMDVGVCEDRGAVEDEGGDEVEGAGAGFAGEHELGVYQYRYAGWSEVRGKRTASSPALSCQGMHSGKRFASVTPMSSFPAAEASIKGVSESLFLLMPKPSWPCSMRNS
jgi:hypothetical protein